MIGYCVWIIVLGGLEIAYDTSFRIGLNMSPREGHLKAVMIILSYLETFPKVRIIIDAT
jgi:hypothetical protein